jgi:phage/conjugal plasmid C-4 type zinc finger TraR family protein
MIEAGDIADAAEQLIELQTDLALRHNRERRDATPQVSLGGCIVCCDCGDAIPPARLESLPHTARCVCCQQVYEQEQARY